MVDSDGYLADKTCFIMICDEPYYLLATLSSRLFEYAYKRIFSSIELGANGYQYNKHALVNLPILLPENLDTEIYNQITKFAQNANLADADVREFYLQKIDELIYLESVNNSV